MFSDSPCPRKHPKGSDIHSILSEIPFPLRHIMEIRRANNYSQYIAQ
jgi:hypothetical protein